MSNSEAKFHLSLSEGILQISGSELFVTQQIENFKDVILESLKSSEKPVKLLPANQSTLNASTNDDTDDEMMTSQFPKALEFDGDKVHVTCKIPGQNKAEKTFNLALIYLWAKKKMGVDTVSSKEIRDQCEIHGCFDSSNFAAHLKKDKTAIILTGTKGGNKDCKLTFPGVDKAEELLKELNAA